jgi:hypothetical protein
MGVAAATTKLTGTVSRRLDPTCASAPKLASRLGSARSGSGVLRPKPMV